MLKKTKPGLKFNPGLALIGLRTTGPDAEVAETSYQFLLLEVLFFLRSREDLSSFTDNSANFSSEK